MNEPVLQLIDPAIYASLALLFGIAAQFRAMDGYSFLRRVLASLEPRLGVLYAVALVTFVFSPFILNDVLVLILTPAVIKYARQYRLDAAPLVVAEITFTNISSSLTPIGNPQNILLWTSSGVGFVAFVGGTWMLVAASAIIAAFALLPLSRGLVRPREQSGPVGFPVPAVYIFLVTATVLFADAFGLATYIPLGVGFLLGFVFTGRNLRQVRKEFDLRSLAVLCVFVASITIASYFLMPLVIPYVLPAAQGRQPYSGLFLGVVSNIISNVPATQLLINTAGVSPALAPKIAVEAGLAGNLGPVASFANLLALQMAAKAGVSVKKTIALQAAVGVLAFIPALT